MLGGGAGARVTPVTPSALLARVAPDPPPPAHGLNRSVNSVNPASPASADATVPTSPSRAHSPRSRICSSGHLPAKVSGSLRRAFLATLSSVSSSILGIESRSASAFPSRFNTSNRPNAFKSLSAVEVRWLYETSSSCSLAHLAIDDISVNALPPALSSSSACNVANPSSLRSPHLDTSRRASEVHRPTSLQSPSGLPLTFRDVSFLRCSTPARDVKALLWHWSVWSDWPRRATPLSDAMRLLYRISARRLVKGASAAPSMSTSWLKLRSRDTRLGVASKSPGSMAATSALWRSATVAEARFSHPVASRSSTRVTLPSLISSFTSSTAWTTSMAVAFLGPSDVDVAFVFPPIGGPGRAAPGPTEDAPSRFGRALSFALALSYALTMLAVRRRPSRRAGTSGATALGGGHEILGTSETGSLTRDATDELAWHTRGARESKDRRCFARCAPWAARASTSCARERR